MNDLLPQPVIRRRGEALRSIAGQEVFDFTLTRAETGGAVGLVERLVSPRFQSPPQAHWHTREDWLGYLLDGELVFQLNGTDHALGAGDCLFVPRGVRFRWWNPADRPARALFLYVPGGFEDFFKGACAVAAARDARLHDYEETLKAIQALHDGFGIVRAE